MAAYARYRILLLHLIRGYLPEANTVYMTLQDKYPAGQPGYAYARMAAALWTEYQTSKDLVLACNKTIAYAKAHPISILAYLGNNTAEEIRYFGWQSLDYRPEDVCPLK